jgi:hypothetical protein
MDEQTPRPERETIEDAWYAPEAIREAVELYLPRMMMRSADDTPSPEDDAGNR